MISERLKKVIFDKLYNDLFNVEIIPYNNIWFIDRDNKYWYFERKNTVEKILNCKVSTNVTSDSEFSTKVKEVLTQT